MKTFHEMGLPESLLHTLQHMQFNEPTPIQSEAIPLALAGKDLLGSAQTGTGKTGAFGIPLVVKLLSDPSSLALVMTPTRELATQVMMQLGTMLGKRTKIKSTLLIGGESISKQLQQLKNRPRLIVGTPGRINDHLKRASLKLDRADFLVLDETDRMLDMGFIVQIEQIINSMATPRQTLLFSATIPNNITRIASQYLNDPVRVATTTTSVPAANIQQDIVHVASGQKFAQLLTQLDQREGSIIIFINTKHGTEKMAKRLSKQDYSVNAIHGDLRQNKRDRVMAAFRQKKYRILVATDVAARGLDIPHIAHVINYDLPQCAEDYIHRIGRTARAGAGGAALNLVTSDDKAKWNAIERLLDPNNLKKDDKKPKMNRQYKGNKSRFKKTKSNKGKNKNNKSQQKTEVIIHKFKKSKPTPKRAA